MTVISTPEGFLKIPARFARSGIYDYMAAELRQWGVTLDVAIPDDAIVKVYRSPEDVFNGESLGSFEHKPVTLGHPVHTVSPATLKDDLVGLSLAPVRKDDDGTHARVDVMLLAQDGISEFRKGTRELSAGYKAEMVLQGGMTADGVPYDAIQRNIRGNHIALVKRGRAGSARLLDDKKGDDMPDKKEDNKDLQAALTDALAEVKALKADNDKLKGQVDALKAQVLTDEQLAERISQAVDQARAEEKVRDDTISRAKQFAPKLEVSDAMTVKDIMVTAIQARSPDLDLKDKSDEYVQGVFDNLKTTSTKHEDDARNNGVKVPQFLGFDKAKALAW